jgi:signal transduction histidine kinase
MDSLINLDLLSVGIVVAATCVLGFAVYFSNRKSITNRVFLAFSIVTAIWGIINYLEFQFIQPLATLWILRSILFLATFHAILIYIFFLVFPSEHYVFPKRYKFIVLFTTLLTALLTLTPLVFKTAKLTENGVISYTTGQGIIFFVVFTIYFTSFAFINAIKRLRKAKSKIDRGSLIIILTGFIISFSLIIILAMIFPVFLNNPGFNKYSSLLIFPFILSCAYVILRHKLLQIKSRESIILTLALLIIIFIGLVYSRNHTEIISAGIVYIVAIIFTVLIIKLIVNEALHREKIEKLAKDLKEANEVRSELIALATHHIATPLTAMKGYVSLIQEGIYGKVPSQISPTIEILERSTNSMSNTIRDFLDVSRIDEGEIKYDFSRFDFRNILERIIDEYRVQIERKEDALTYDFDTTQDYSINADQDRIKRAISNLVENSIKYTSHGLIKINLSKKDNKILLWISDTGARSLPTVSPRLSKKFNQTGNETEANIVGNALGLYSAKKIIEHHQGKLTIQSTDFEKGILFEVIV